MEKMRLPDAENYLKRHGMPITQVQLRNWHKAGKIPGMQPMRHSPLLIARTTLDAIIRGDLPKQ